MFQKTIGFRMFFFTSLVLIGVFVFFPLLWMINTALKPAELTFSLAFFSTTPTLENFQNVLKDKRILIYLGNSLTVASISCILSMVVASLAAYSFSKFRYRGRRSLMVTIMISQAFPHAILLLTILSLIHI